MKKKRILYLVPHRAGRSPGQRFRCEHFIPSLIESGFEINYSNILSAWDDKHFYSHRNYLIKLFIVAKSFIKRIKDIVIVKRYDAVFIYREAYMLGTVFFERIIKRLGVPIIFDFDDSIWLNDTSQGNKELKWMKRPSKTADICKLATAVIVGNSYLADYAKQYNKNVTIIPTTIDTDYHKPQQASINIKETPVNIGWTGTRTTLKHLTTIRPVLIKLKEKYGNKIQICVIADIAPTLKDIDINFVKWSFEKEIEQLSQFDIGVMPLPDNQWTRGKCGFKGLQYMALEIPSVMSPVGVNNDIIVNGDNGFLPTTKQDWIEILSMLIENRELRTKIGKAGRETVIEKFSVKNNIEPYMNVINGVIN